MLQEAQEEDTTEKEQLEPSARPNRRRRRTQKKQKEQGRTVGQTEPTMESGDEPGPSQEGRDLRRTSGFPPAGSSSASSAEQEEAQTARPAELGGEPGAGSRSNIDGRDLGRTSGFPLVGYGSARSAGPGKSQAARQAVLGETPEGDMNVSQEGRDWRDELSSAGADWPYSRLPHREDPTRQAGEEMGRSISGTGPDRQSTEDWELIFQDGRIMERRKRPAEVAGFQAQDGPTQGHKGPGNDQAAEGTELLVLRQLERPH